MSELSLEIVEGGAAGRQAHLSAPLEIGRGMDAGLVLDDPLASRRHARVSPEGEVAVVEDLDSLNGTFVNQEEIHAPTRILPGDHVVVGTTVIELRTAAQVRARPSAVRPRPPALAMPERRPDYVPPDVLDEPGGGARRRAHELDPLLDVHTKAKARTAPLALFVLVVLAILILLARGYL